MAKVRYTLLLALQAVTQTLAGPLPVAKDTLSLAPSLFEITLNASELESLGHVARGMRNKDSISKRQMDEYRAVLDDKETFCNSWNRETLEGARDSLVKTGALIYLGTFIDMKVPLGDDGQLGLGGDPTDWLKKFEETLSMDSSGATGGDGCWDIAHDCKPGGPLFDKECSYYFDGATKVFNNNAEKNEEAALLLSDMIKTSYWIFETVKGTHEKIRALMSRLFRQALVTDLQIDEMVGRLAPADESSAASDILGSISTAFGLAGAFSGLGSGPVSAAISEGSDIMGSILDAVGSELEEEPQEVDTGSIRGALGSFVGQTEDYLERTLMLAMGKRSPKEPGGLSTKLDFWRLPHFNAAKLLSKQPLAFFHNGYWVLGTDGEGYASSLNEFRVNMQATVVHNIIKADGIFLYGNRDISEGECKAMPNARWNHIAKRDAGYCFHLAKKNDYNNFADVDEDKYAALKEYGVYDLGVYFKAVIECGNPQNSDRGEKKPKFSWGMGAETGKVPHCHFNLPVATQKTKACDGNTNQVMQHDCIELIDLDCDSNGQNCEG